MPTDGVEPDHPADRALHDVLDEMQSEEYSDAAMTVAAVAAVRMQSRWKDAGGDNRHYDVKVLGTDHRHYTVCACQLSLASVTESGNVAVSELLSCPES